MENISNYLKFSFVILIACLIAYYVGSCKTETVDDPTSKTDTVYIDRQFTDTVVIHTVTPAKTITVYLKPDTVKRKAMEQATLIQGLKIEPKGIELLTIDTAGFSTVKFYPVEFGSSIAINDTGAVEIKPISTKKARLIKAGKVAIIVATFIAGALIF